MSFLEHPVQIKKEEHSLTTSQKMLLYMWASYINHKIRLGKFSQVDYNHDLTNSIIYKWGRGDGLEV